MQHSHIAQACARYDRRALCLGSPDLAPSLSRPRSAPVRLDRGAVISNSGYAGSTAQEESRQQERPEPGGPGAGRPRGGHSALSERSSRR